MGMFPLRLFLLHQERTTLHIHESRFLQLISDCIKNDTYFGIPFQSKTKFHEHGSIVKVVEITKEYNNGEIDVLVECVQNFKLISFESQAENKLYPSGSIQLLNPLSIHHNDELFECANDYNKLLLRQENEESENGVDIREVISLLSLKDEEKLKLFRYNPIKQIQFLIHKLKYMSILVHKEKLVEHQYHLN